MAYRGKTYTEEVLSIGLYVSLERNGSKENCIGALFYEKIDDCDKCKRTQ